MSKSARRTMIIFALMIALIFYLSSSIRYWMTPKVMLSSVTAGTIVWQRQISELRWSSPQIKAVTTSPYLPDGIKAVDVNGQKFQARNVLKGEKLIALDPVALDRAIVDAKEAYASQLAYEMAYRRELADAQKSAQEAFTQAESALEKGTRSSEKRKEQLRQAYQTAQENYALIVTQGIYSGTTLEVVVARTQATQACLEALEDLRQNGYALIAPCDGMMVSWPGEINQDMLQPNQRYFEIIPDDANRQVVVALEEEGVWPENLYQISLTDPTQPLERYSLSVVEKNIVGQGSMELILEGDASVMEKLDLSKPYTLSYESDNYQALIPNAAFVTEDTVYVLKDQYSDGHWEKVIQAVKVEREPGNAFYTPVSGSIQAGDQVVTGWDRPLVMGQSVIVLESEKQ